MLERLETLRKEGLEKISAAVTEEKLQEVRQQLTGKKGQLTAFLKELGTLAPEMRKPVGQKANEIKNFFSDLIEKRQNELIAQKSAVEGSIDLSRPGTPVMNGGLHPITQMCYDLNDAFLSMGFEIFSEDDISSEKFAFDNLNFPPDHPARETMDTYWLEGTENKSGCERLCLRPHLTGASVRYLKKHGAPARFVYPGAVYRNEATDSHHERSFAQYEALIVEKDLSFASGKVLIETILEKVFGRHVNIRMRAGFFPFVEPGFEIDMECLICGGKGCSVCKNVGWIEIMPGGVPHPNVLKAAGLDPEVWSGFYINIGLDRLVMMRYGVDDIRLFRGADLRFLQQFK